MMLGDAVHEALELIGVTDERVQRWLGETCGGCKERRERLNALGAWASRVLRGKVRDAKELLRRLTDADRPTDS